MNLDGPDVVCWNCIKGRHAICTGTVEESDQDDRGKPCECPVCHGNRMARRQPVWDPERSCYYDPGLVAEPRDDIE